MMRLRLVVFSSLVFGWAGCVCGPLGVETIPFACSTDGDCTEGFSCRPVDGVAQCVPNGMALDAGGDAGVDAGRDAGVADAGDDSGVDAGEPDAGEPDAGEPDAGTADAGDDAGLADSGVDGGTDAGVDAGFDAGVDGGPIPIRVRFTTPPRAAAPGACSGAITIATLNSADQQVSPASATPVALSADGGVSFFDNATCTPPAVTAVTIPANQSSVTVSASAAAVGTVTLRASSPPLISDTQPFIVQQMPNTLVFIGAAPTPRAGECLPQLVEARNGTVSNPVALDTMVGLSVAAANTVQFYEDATCTRTNATTVISAGSSVATFFVKFLTGGSSVLSASAPFGSATRAVSITPMVRRGTCDFNFPTQVLIDGGADAGLDGGQLVLDGGFTYPTSSTCTFSPALGNLNSSFVTVNATALPTGNGDNGSSLVRCRLTSTTSVGCNRSHNGVPATAHYQVVEIPVGLRVQRVSTGCTATGGVLVLDGGVVDVTKTFTLFSLSNPTGAFDDDETPRVMVLNSTSVSISPPTCNVVDLQVLEWDGVTVTRGVFDAGVGGGALATGVASRTDVGLPASSLSAILLAQSGTTTDGTRSQCGLQVRGRMPSQTSVVLSRGAGDAGCPLEVLEQLAYERIDFGAKARVNAYNVTLPVGTLTTVVTTTPVDLTRSVVVASSQSSGGQGSGESDDPGVNSNADTAARFVLTANNVTVTRARAQATATFTFYVVELNP